MSVSAIVTDIEGTTTEIAFVHKVLFPYAFEHLPAFIRKNANEPAVKRDCDQARVLMQAPLAPLEAVISQVLQWIRDDAKVTPLKSLQGMVWAQGYAEGAYQSHIYDDAWQYLTEWSKTRALYVYSSGSVAAQKLLFGHTTHGDMTPLFSGYFDTNVGPKREAASYRAILAALGLPGPSVLFLTDIKEECSAAREAGLQVFQIVREGPLPMDAAWPVGKDFSSGNLVVLDLPKVGTQES